MKALILSVILAAPWNIIPYQIDVMRDGKRLAHLEPEISEQVQDTINRYYREHVYLYLDGDKLTFEVTSIHGDVWKMWGCIFGDTLIITANNPLACQ